MGGRRFLPNTDEDRRLMLEAIGLSSAEELFAEIPPALRLSRPLSLPQALPEYEIGRLAKDLAARNKDVDDAVCFLGAGAYDHFIPSIVPHLAFRSEFYTAYTQYQAEISQGGLQALWEYQSFICELTGLDVANSSLYDGGTALAEAMNMACGATGRSKVVVSQAIHPFYRRILETYAYDFGFEIVTAPAEHGVTDIKRLVDSVDNETAVAIVQYPNFFGVIEDLAGVADAVHAKGALLLMAVNPIAMAILKSPGDLGADIAVGEGQPLGLSLSFGGPYLGFMAVREKLVRRMPGRIVGQTADSRGNRGFVLTLQAREQHIRREKAYSNICSNEGLCAITAAIYLSAVGKQGLAHVAKACAQKAHYAAGLIKKLPGYSLAFAAPFFHEFVVRAPRPVNEINARLQEHNIIGGLDLARFDQSLTHHMLICVTEKRTKSEIDTLVEVLGGMA